MRIPILVEELAEFARKDSLIGIGVPLPRGAVYDPTDLTLTDEDERQLPTQTRVLAFWPDNSIKWVLVNGLVTVRPRERRLLYLSQVAQPSPEADAAALHVHVERRKGICVDTGVANFRIGGEGALIESAELNGVPMLDTAGIHLSLTGCTGRPYWQVTRAVRIDEGGPIRATIVLVGHFAASVGRWGAAAPIEFMARLSFSAGSSLVTVDLQLHNPRAARHPGGLWDLNDQGTVLFEDVSLSLKPAGRVEQIRWYAEHPVDMHVEDPGNWSLYQDSSGGENWDSDNHVDGDGNSTVRFRGYRVTYGQAGGGCLIAEGDRATPGLSVVTDRGAISATVLEFWQNFPKAIRWDASTLDLGLFPWECRAPFALQGGERKRHTAVIEFSSPQELPTVKMAQQPLRVSLDPAWVEKSRAIDGFISTERDANETYRTYIRSIIDGQYSFEKKREAIDEYGWRNFGDLYADHEGVRSLDPRPLVSHYNNQYDFIYGALIHYLKSADTRWWTLARDAARHSIDIDIYHTDADRPAFNHGLFWHTDHYKPVGTCTHRTYSRRNGSSLGYGGGPGNEHNYTSGLLLYYFLTGDPEGAEAVRELAAWVMGMDMVKEKSRCGEGKVTGLASQTADSSYHKPGRGAGNSINAVLDAYQLGEGQQYLAKAEDLIRRCIHPRDDIDALGLSMPENRWSYLVFLQVLGKYIHLKLEKNETDYMFHYARESLLHYARWMLHNEVPYKDVLDRVDLPTETWPAQDVRKSHVLHLAGEFSAEPERSAFHDRADFFFERSLRDLLSFDTAFLTRPLVIMCVYGHLHAYYQEHRSEGIDLPCPFESFGKPQVFVPEQGGWRGRVRDLRTRLIRTGLERLDIVHRFSTPTRL